MLNFEYSENPTLSASKIRLALQAISSQARAFETNSTGCALEAFEEILKYLHIEHIQYTDHNQIENEDLSCRPCSPLCIAHTVFGTQIVERK